jgi:hypothetical protein
MSNVAFPFPVLGRGDDYLKSDFQIALRTVDLIIEDTSLIELPYRFDLSNEEIKNLINHEKAKFGFEISCSATAMRYVQFADEEGTLSLDPRNFFRSVNINPRIFVIEEIKNFKSDDFNPEFGEATFDFEPGDFLAAAEEDTIYIDFQYLSFQDSAIVKRSSDLDPWVYSFGLEGDTIVIAMGERFHDYWSLAKSNKSLAPHLITTVYKDCIVAALDQICLDPSAESLSWARGLLDMLDTNKILLPEKPSFSDLNVIAQDLVKNDGVKKVEY